MRGEPLKIYGDGAAIRAWCYVSDFVDGVVRAIDSDAAIGQVFNIGNPREVETTLGLARHIMRLVPGTRCESHRVDRTDVRARVPSIEKARTLADMNRPSIWKQD